MFFNYPDDVLKDDPLMINSITVNMALAQTPDNPQEQFRNIDRPFAIFVGVKDELFDTGKVVAYLELAAGDVRKASTAQIIENRKHLSILLVSGGLIGDFILGVLAG